MAVTSLYVRAILYDIFEDELFEAILPIRDITVDYYNEDFPRSCDLKKIKYKGEVKNTAQGSILLGTL
jgi:hypothetical protein